MMKKFLRSRKVLVVLDDVDHIEQLEALTVRNWFKPGSRIIITTRYEQVLHADGVNSIHDVNLLSNDEAIFMFRWYAFGREIEIEGYKELSRQVVRYAAGLPLTIKVLGSFICCKDEIEWKDAIERLKTIPLEETLKKLELSYNSLEEDYKEIFLDVACLLKGLKENKAIRVLESCGFHAKIGLRVLEQKSLITISEYGSLGMHDHLEEMGRNIVRRSHPDEPQRHSRLWVNEEIEDILTNDLGTQATKCLYFQSWDFSAESDDSEYSRDLGAKIRAMLFDKMSILPIKGLAKMKDLIFIHIHLEKYCYGMSNVVQFDKVSEYLPSSLRFMRWYGFPFSSLPNTFQGKYLVELDIHRSNIVQLWEDGEGKVLPKPRFFTIRHSKLRTFDLRLAPNLDQLTIDECYDLVEFQMPANHHPMLEYLTLIQSELTTLHLGNTPNLKTLILECCNHLVELQMPAESLKLEHLKLSQSKLTNLHLGNTPNLEKLILVGCNDLVELQMQSPKFEEVNISYSKLKTLYLGSTLNLKRLTLKESDDLVELQMPVESPKLKCLLLSDTKLRTLDLGLTTNLEWLKLVNCYDLVEINAPIGCLKNLLVLDLRFCGRFDSFVFYKWCQPVLVSLSELHLIAKPTDVCLLHPGNSFPMFRFDCYYKEDRNSSFGNFERLLGLCPDSICKLKHLKSFEIKYCWLLEKLPEDIGRLESLKKLILTSCQLLLDIPNSICKMKSINKLHLAVVFKLLNCLRKLDA